MQQAGIAVLEVTTPDKQDRRRRGKNDDLDAQNAAHAAFAGQRTVTPRSRDGMIESLRVLMACRKTAVSARRVALQMIHNTIVCAPDSLRDQLRSLTRMQLVRTLAAWRPDLTAYRDLDSAYRIGLKSLARRYLELHDEIADLDVMIAAIVDELAPNLVARNSIGHVGAAQLLLTAGDNPERLRSEASFASLCGVSPVPASSEKTVRNSGGPVELRGRRARRLDDGSPACGGVRLVPGTPHVPASDEVAWLGARVAELEAQNARLREVAVARDELAAAQLAARDALIEALTAQVEELQRRMDKDSMSSKPPSSDSPYQKKPRDRSLRGKSGRKPGKQPGAQSSTPSAVTRS